MKTLTVIIAALALVGCAGEFDVFADQDDPQILLPNGTDTNDDSDPTSPETGGGTGTTPLAPGFEVHKEEVRLLPFHIRMQKLGSLTGLSSNDPLFDELRDNRYDLGDHNYAQGIGADLSWNASKISIWVRGLQPICASEAMSMRYTELPAQLDELILAAYGREATPDDIATFDDALSDVQLDDAARYQAVCLAVLTSSEFVAQ